MSKDKILENHTSNELLYIMYLHWRQVSKNLLHLFFRYRPVRVSRSPMLLADAIHALVRIVTSFLFMICELMSSKIMRLKLLSSLSNVIHVKYAKIT